MSPGNAKGQAMPKALQAGYAFEGDNIVPLVTKNGFTDLDEKEQASLTMEKEEREAMSPASTVRAVRRLERLTLVRLDAAFLGSAVNIKQIVETDTNKIVPLPPEKRDALAMNALLVISMKERGLSRVKIARLLDKSTAAVSQHGNLLTETFGERALLPGERSQEYRRRCRQAAKRRKKDKP